MATFALPARVFVREVATSYARCLRVDTAVRMDVDAARRQHAAYVATIRRLGVTVDAIPTDDACPDACFVEDTAVLLPRGAVLTRPGAEARRSEIADVGAALDGHMAVHTMSGAATLDGGDVLRVDGQLFVGISSRTNLDGAHFLARIAAMDGLGTVTLTVRDGLHLKSACTLASASVLVYDANVLRDDDLTAFRDAGLTCIAASEPSGANVLALGRSVLVSAAAPRTAERLAATGLDVRVVDVGEMHKGDGALTCLSLRVPAPGAWCT